VYNVIGTSIYGCRDSVLVPVSVPDTNKNTISSDTVICLGQSAQLIATSTDYRHGKDPEYYLWTPATGLNNPNIPTPIATPDTTTTYNVIIKENVCFSDTEHVTVYVQPAPAITITTSQRVVAGTAVQLSASIGNEVLLSDYEWTPADYSLSCYRCYGPIATPTVTTTYTFTATSVYGCVSSADVTISLFCDGSQVFIPNTFTPNGDGANDRFYINAKGVSLVVRLSVYNRWGELVFESLNSQPNDPAAGWDGTYKGLVLEPDVFVYVAEVICEIGNEPFSFKGDVSIVR
jgi:gliding motility-associated-like protein